MGYRDLCTGTTGISGGRLLRNRKPQRAVAASRATPGTDNAMTSSAIHIDSGWGSEMVFTSVQNAVIGRVKNGNHDKVKSVSALLVLS